MYAGNNQALLKAARARKELEKERIIAILNDQQKDRFNQMMADRELTDKAIIISERLGLDRTTTQRINKIAARLPDNAEIAAARQSDDLAGLNALYEKTDTLYAEIEYFLNEQEKAVFKALRQELKE